MSENKENILSGYPNIISYECSKKIIKQMERNICKIKIGKELGTGFFCIIPFPDLNNMLSVFITNNHTISKELLYKDSSIIDIDIEEEKNIKKLNLNNRMKYTNEKYDITIIEIKKEDEINNYLELDDNIINDIINNINKNKNYLDKTIYIIQYPRGELGVSYGILNIIYEDKKYNFNHKCSTEGGSSGSPILNINNKLIGIHKGGYNNKNNIGTFLNYPIKEFIQLYRKKNELLIQEFNTKYELNIKDKNITELNLGFKNIGEEGLKELCKIEFKELKELNLFGNNIWDIKVLEKVKFEKLKILDLRHNLISDIRVLEKVNFNQLKELFLSFNNISDIKVLEKVKFEELEKLYLSANKISNINVLEKVNFKELKVLYLHENIISDIKVLEKVKFEKLEILSLGWNNISDINILEKVNFKELKDLDLDHNDIWDIKVLEKVKLEKLEILSLRYNEISDINVLEKVNFPELKELYLHENNIWDIKVLERVKFEKLEILDLRYNKILDNYPIKEKLKIKELFV